MADLQKARSSNAQRRTTPLPADRAETKPPDLKLPDAKTLPKPATQSRAQPFPFEKVAVEDEQTMASLIVQGLFSVLRYLGILSAKVSPSSNDQEEPEDADAWPIQATWFSPKDESLGLFIILVVASFATRFFLLWHPAEVVFDEVHFGKFTNGYLTGKYYFDIHPPLGKLVLGLVTSLAPDYQGDFKFEHIGDKYYEHPNVPYILMRSFPALFNSLMTPVIFCAAREFGMSLPAAFMCACWTLFDTGMLLQSKLILIDSFLIFSISLSFLCTMALQNYATRDRVLKPGYFAWLVATGFAAGCAGSVKWTGLAVIAGIGIQHVAICLWRLVTKRPQDSWFVLLADLLLRALLLATVPILTYLFFQWWHFRLLDKSGPGDNFMTPQFRSTLMGSRDEGRWEPPTFMQKVWELCRTMFATNAGIKTPHHWQSEWWTWPLDKRGLSFWHGRNVVSAEKGGEMVSRMYLVGNPAVWWTSTFLLALSFPCFLWAGLFEIPLRRRTKLLLAHGTLLVIHYVMNLAPYVAISRSTFIYHYFPGLICAIFLSGLLLDHLFRFPRDRLVAAAILTATSAASFLYFAPLAYGIPLSSAAYERRIWLQGWR